MKKRNKSIKNGEKDMAHKWKLRRGNILVVEDAHTASLVIIAKELKDVRDKIAVLKEVLRKFETRVVQV